MAIIDPEGVLEVEWDASKTTGEPVKTVGDNRPTTMEAIGLAGLGFDGWYAESPEASPAPYSEENDAGAYARVLG